MRKAGIGGAASVANREPIQATDGRRPRIVVAPDKFKGTLSAIQVAEAIVRGLREADADLEILSLPIADGGEGSVDAAVRSGFGEIVIPATDERGVDRLVRVAVSGDTAVVEVAAICGLGESVPTAENSLRADSVGVGQVLLELLDKGIRKIVIGLGGSATTDGGVGMLSALGAQFLDENGSPVGPGGGSLRSIAQIDMSQIDRRLLEVEIILACDVDNPLTGTEGAAQMYGPQKGAGANELSILEAGLANLVRTLDESEQFAHLDATPSELATRPGAGAAGGLAFGGLLVGASIQSGAQLFLDLLDAGEILTGAALLITGEGQMDRQSLQGKAPVAIARLAEERGVPVVAIVGSNLLDADEVAGVPFVGVVAIGDIDARCSSDPALSMSALTQLGRQILSNTRLEGMSVHTATATVHKGATT